MPAAWSVFSEGLGIPSWLFPPWSLKECQWHSLNLLDNHKSGGQCSHIGNIYLLIQVNSLCKLDHVLLTWFFIYSILRPCFFYARASHSLSIIPNSLQYLPWVQLYLKLLGDFLSVCIKETSYWIPWPTHCLIHPTE